MNNKLPMLRDPTALLVLRVWMESLLEDDAALSEQPAPDDSAGDPAPPPI